MHNLIRVALPDFPAGTLVIAELSSNLPILSPKCISEDHFCSPESTPKSI